MVSGFTKFKERFQGFENQYVIIGGTACDLIMENEELPFRATKDVDIVLIVESITAEFGRQFWEYVKEAGYEHLNKSTGNAQFYRFTSPKSKEYGKSDGYAESCTVVFAEFLQSGGKRCEGETRTAGGREK